MKKKLLATLICVCLAPTILVGCGDSGNKESSGTDSAVTPSGGARSF